MSRFFKIIMRCGLLTLLVASGCDMLDPDPLPTNSRIHFSDGGNSKSTTVDVVDDDGGSSIIVPSVKKDAGIPTINPGTKNDLGTGNQTQTDAGQTVSCNEGETKCSGTKIVTCVKNSTTGALAWGTAASCPTHQTCQGAACACKNTCSTVGNTSCAYSYASYESTCTQDSAGCLYLANQACASGYKCVSTQCEYCSS